MLRKRNMEYLVPTAAVIGMALIYRKSNVPPRVLMRIRNHDSYPIQYQHFKQRDLLHGGPAPGVPINLQTGPQKDLDPQVALGQILDEYNQKLQPSDMHFQILAQSVGAGQQYVLRDENGRHLQVLMPAYNGELLPNTPYKNNGLPATQTPLAWK
jgi:hypothetical protein